MVERLGMRSSMGRTGVCWSNAVTEAFFLTLKNDRAYPPDTGNLMKSATVSAASLSSLKNSVPQSGIHAAAQ